MTLSRHAGAVLVVGALAAGLAAAVVPAVVATAGSAAAAPAVARTSLAPLTTVGPGTALTSRDGTFSLVLQGDGNLVLVGPRVVWATGTVGRGATQLAVQGDGNLVLYTASGAPVWASGTAGSGQLTLALSNTGGLTLATSGGRTAWSVTAPATDVLGANAPLSAGEALLSSDHRWLLALQGDGNLVLYAMSRSGAGGPATGITPAWASNTASGTAASRAQRLVLQGDGNLVLYTAAGVPVWSSGTVGDPARVGMPTRLTVTNDGHVTLTAASTGAQAWSSTTTRDALWSGQVLSMYQSLVSPNGSTLVLQGDANLVRYDAAGVPRWSTGTVVPGATDAVFAVQADGNAVLYVAGKAKWASNTNDGRGVVVRQLDTGGAVLLDAAAATVWSDSGPNWTALARCESGGNPKAVNPAGYYGLYQFDLSTWAAYGGTGNPVDATPDEQTRIAAKLYAARGRQPWPTCGVYM